MNKGIKERLEKILTQPTEYPNIVKRADPEKVNQIITLLEESIPEWLTRKQVFSIAKGKVDEKYNDCIESFNLAIYQTQENFKAWLKEENKEQKGRS